MTIMMYELNTKILQPGPAVVAFELPRHQCQRGQCGNREGVPRPRDFPGKQLTSDPSFGPMWSPTSKRPFWNASILQSVRHYQKCPRNVKVMIISK